MPVFFLPLTCLSLALLSIASPAKGAPERLPSAPRIIAIGDIHGDFQVLQKVLMLAGITNQNGHWTGGTSVVVQLGDEIDRGDDDRKVIEYFDALAAEAVTKGGAVYPLLGNHEIMNARWDFRYVTGGSWSDFDDLDLDLSAEALRRFPPNQRSRAAAFQPGGPIARRLAQRNMVQIIGDTAFVHGTVEPRFARSDLGAANDAVKQWLAGRSSALPEAALAADGVVWSRAFGQTSIDCSALTASLTGLRVKRMVVAHTVQPNGINSVCGGQVWRIDVGLSAYYGGLPQVLEIKGDSFQVIRSTGHDVN